MTSTKRTPNISVGYRNQRTGTGCSCTSFRSVCWSISSTCWSNSRTLQSPSAKSMNASANEQPSWSVRTPSWNGLPISPRMICRSLYAWSQTTVSSSSGATKASSTRTPTTSSLSPWTAQPACGSSSMVSWFTPGSAAGASRSSRQAARKCWRPRCSTFARRSRRAARR